MPGLLSPAVTGEVMDFDPYNVRSQTDPSMQYGALIETNHGRNVWRYGKVGGANVSKGKLQLGPAPIANHQVQTVNTNSNVAVGSTRLTLDNGGTAAVAGEYDQGVLSIVHGTGLGQTFGVLHNAVATSSASIVVDIDGPGVQVALVGGTSKYVLEHNPYNGFVEAASKTRTAAGIPRRDLTTAYFGWLQTKGITAALIGSAATLGARLTSDGSTAGAVTDNTDVTAPQAEVEVGQASIVAGTTSDYDPIVLSID